MITTELSQLLAHMEWADARTWCAVTAAGAGDDSRIRGLSIHVHTVQWAYLQLWRGETIRIPAPETLPDPAAVQAWARDYYAQSSAFLAGLDASTLERTIEFPWAEQLVSIYGQVHPTTLRQAMLQVPMHSAHHRAQLCTRLRELGAEPPLVDFVAWVWLGTPTATWPETSA